MPNTEVLEYGNEWVVSTWDILAGDVKPAESALVFDYNGGHQALTAAEFMLDHCCELEIATPERMLGPDIGGLNTPPYLKAFAEHGVQQTLSHQLTGVRRENGRLVATLRNRYADITSERVVDQVVVEHGILPLDDLYFELKALSCNRGELDHQAFIDIEPQLLGEGGPGFQLFRIGDAVNSRDIHAAIYDGMRLSIAL
ncbi:hypothetical protein J3P96_16905 [Pseudomonas sp. R3-56]|uniref:hypothetical protein n=1 Tax=Pseudomonas sp. R3-56 TaxID=2817401 RepID=UPI003DA92D6F